MTRRPIIVSALAAAAVVALTGCLPDELLVEPTRTPTTEPTADPPPATHRAAPSTERATPTSSTPVTGATGATGATTEPGDGEESGRTAHTPSASAEPTAFSTPPIVCPHVIALDPTFEVTAAGTDETTGNDVVEVVVRYTNPVDYSLWLRGSIGYLDSENAEGDLYSLEPGDIAFEDIELPPGEGALKGSFEDVWGEVTQSQLYFTSWIVSGLPVDTSGQPPCETNRGYTNH